MHEEWHLTHMLAFVYYEYACTNITSTLYILQHPRYSDGVQNPSAAPTVVTYPKIQGLTNQQEDQFIARAAEALNKVNVLADLYVSYHRHSRGRGNPHYVHVCHKV